MIKYKKRAFGLNLLLRVNGSATFRAIIPALLAMCVLMGIKYIWEVPTQSELLHPYVAGVLIGGITFLLVFRMTQAYGRYWSATGAVYKMQSKWMDATVHTATYHLQSPQYDKIRPPSYSKNHHLNEKFLTRDRERLRASRDTLSPPGKISSKRAMLRSIEAIKHTGKSNTKKRTARSATPSSFSNLGVEDGGLIPVIRTLNKNPPDRISTRRFEQATVPGESRSGSSSSNVSNAYSDGEGEGKEQDVDDNDDELPAKGVPRFLSGRPRLDGNWEQLFDDGKSTFIDPQNPSHIELDGFASVQGGHTPILFLQELAHLSSLMNAVALSTLRNDVEGVASPLSLYHPGSPWPEVDPQLDQYLYDSRVERYWFAFLYFLGQGRTPAERTRYNVARPISVLGGVSDAEIKMLQTARGPLAKTQLCFFWLSEFAIREYEEGAHGALISRCMQFLSDGMIAYNEARKIMFNPFPFPHAQLSSVFVNLMIFVIPLLMVQYIRDLWLAAIFTFLSVMILTSIDEVARELENPFRNIPNELPLVTYQAEFNEALLTIYSGFHPDSFWEPQSEEKKKYPPSTDADDEPFTVPSSFVESSTIMPSIIETPTRDEGTDGKKVIDCNKSEDQKKMNAQLCLIVEQQGRMMEKMMTEQKRLNTMMEEMLSNK